MEGSILEKRQKEGDWMARSPGEAGGGAAGSRAFVEMLDTKRAGAVRISNTLWCVTHCVSPGIQPCIFPSLI